MALSLALPFFVPLNRARTIVEANALDNVTTPVEIAVANWQAFGNSFPVILWVDNEQMELTGANSSTGLALTRPNPQYHPGSPTISAPFDATHLLQLQNVLNTAIVSCRVTNSTNQSVNHNTNTVLGFDTKRWDPYSIYSTSTHRITPGQAGIGLVGYDLAFAGTNNGTPGYRRQVQIILNATTPLLTDARTPIGNSIETAVSGCTLWQFGATDYATLSVYNDTDASAANILSNSDPDYGGEFWFWGIYL
jgi:hypothetical protein